MNRSVSATSHRRKGAFFGWRKGFIMLMADISHRNWFHEFLIGKKNEKIILT